MIKHDECTDTNNIPELQNNLPIIKKHRERHGAIISKLIRAWRSAEVAACVQFRIPLALIQINMFIPSQSLDIVKMLCPWAKALHPQMLHLTQVKLSTW